MHVIRSFARWAALAAVVALAAAPARPDGGEDGASTDDLIGVFRPFYGGGGGNKWGKASRDVPWTDWWYANRRALGAPGRRVGASATDAPVRDDPAARGRARDALLEALGAKEPLVASEAALALGRLGDARDIETLARILDDRDVAGSRRLHRYAAIGMGLLPKGDEQQSARARTALIGAITSARGGTHEFSFHWSYCAYALGMRGDAAIVPDLVALRSRVLDAKNSQSSIYIEVLGAVCYALGSLVGEVALPEIEEHLSGRKAPDGGSNDTSWSATQTLARVGGERATKVLLDALGDDRWTVRAGALQALGALAGPKDDAVAAALSKALDDDRQFECRRMAAVALGRSGHPTALAALTRALDKATSDVRPFAAIGLGLLARRKADPAVDAVLLAALRDSRSDDAQGGAALACGLAGVVAARPRLAEIVEKGGPTAGPLAAYALGVLGANDDERKVLHKAVADSGSVLERREAALALAALGDREVVDQLHAIVASRASDRDRGTAVICLGRVADDTEIDFLVGVIRSGRTSDQLRACALHALGWLLDGDDLGRLSRVAADVKWDKHVNGTSLSWSGEAMWDIQHLVD